MKSRFLTSITVALTLLLGLVSSNLMAQITASSSVDFKLVPYRIDGTAMSNITTSANEDTVGHKFGLIIPFEAVKQELAGGVNLDITLPTGTIINQSELKDGAGVQIFYSYSSSGLVTQSQYYVDAANITVIEDNPYATPSNTVRPRIRIKETTTFTTERQVELRILKGLYHGKNVLLQNDADLVDDKVGNLYFKFVHGSSIVNDGTYYDSTSFYVQNDNADGVVSNSNISSVIKNTAWSAADSIIIVDRFGNFVPDFFNGSKFSKYDSLVIYTASGNGNFNVTPQLSGTATAWDANDNASLFGAAGTTYTWIDSALGTANSANALDTIYLLEAAATNTRTLSLANFRAQTEPAYAGAGTAGNATDARLWHNVTGDGTSTVIDSSFTILYLGAKGYSDKVPGLGLKFTPETGKSSAVFSIKVMGPRASTGTLLGVASSRISTITRSFLETTDDGLVGRVVINLNKEVTTKTNMNTNQIYNGSNLGKTWTVDLYDRFGVKFSGTKSLTNATSGAIEPLVLEYRYVDVAYATGGAVNALSTLNVNTTKNGILNNGTTVAGYTRKPSHFILDGTIKNPTDLAAGVDSIVGTSIAASGVVTLTSARYLGTTSRGYGDGILVIVRSKSGYAADSALITVDPSPPITWDIRKFHADTLATVGIYKDLPINKALPIYALDTTYNYITNLDLNTATTYLGTQTVGSAPAVKAINFQIDGRDPAGHASTTYSDSIRFDTLTVRTGLTADQAADSSFIYGYSLPRADSSMINLGGTGDQKVGMRLNYLGPRRLTMQWMNGDAGSAYTTGAGAFLTTQRQLDLGILNIQNTTGVDSVTNLKANIAVTIPSTSADTAGGTLVRAISFTALAGNTVSPQVDSIIFVKFPYLTGDAGLWSTFNKDSVKISIDGGVTKYSSAWVGGSGDSIAIGVPFLLDPSTYTITIYLHQFKNPTRSDTTYLVQLATKASPIWATSSYANGYTPGDGGYHKMLMLSIGDSVKTNAKWSDQLTKISTAVTLKAGVQSGIFTITPLDLFGNIIGNTALTKPLKFQAPDTTRLGLGLVVKQTANGAVKTSSGAYTAGLFEATFNNVRNIGGETRAYYDSLSIIPARAGSYYVVAMDSANTAIKDSILVTVQTTTSGSISVVSPLGKQSVAKGTTVDSALTVKLYDTYGNALADSLVTFGVIFGSGTFVDSNGVAITSANDTISVKTNAMGQATAKVKAATTGDSIAVAVYSANTAVTKKYFGINTTATTNLGPTTITFLTVPDSMTADTAAAKSVVVKVADEDGVKKVKLLVSTFTLTLGTDNKFTKSATSVDTTIWDSTMKATKPAVDTVTFSIPKKAVGSQVEYTVTAYDANDSTVVSAMKSYIVGSKRGKSKLSSEPVNVADIMRLVYLVLGFATPNAIDYFGLDLNQDGAFTGDADLVKILEIWKGTSTLASSTEQQKVTAKASLSFKEIDKASANLFIDLENQGALNYAEFQVKYDNTKYSFGEVSRTERIDQNVQVVFNNRQSEGILHIIVINLQGRSIASGSGSVLSVPVQALNGKFDGTGEISLLSAGFGQNVQSELSKEVLSPKASLPKAFALGQNYPNPFNPSTTVAYDIPEGKEVQVRLNIYNVRGQLVRTLVDEVKSEGSYQIQWDGSSNNGQKVSSGVYFYRLVAGEFNQTRKMVILK